MGFNSAFKDLTKIQCKQLALDNENWEEIYKQDNINNKFPTFLIQ